MHLHGAGAPKSGLPPKAWQFWPGPATKLANASKFLTTLTTSN